MLKPPRDAHEAFIGLGPNLKDISSFVGDRRLPPKESQLLADMLLGYFLGLACEHRRATCAWFAMRNRRGYGRPRRHPSHAQRPLIYNLTGHRVATSHVRGRVVRGKAAIIYRLEHHVPEYLM